MKNAWTLALGLAALTALTGCPQKTQDCIFGDEEGCDAGTPPPDLCNSIEEALTDPQCKLGLGPDGGFFDRFIGAPGDQDWYLAELPGGLTARSLLHVNGGYGVPNTAVNFAVNVLREDGASSIAREVDKHGQAAPKPVDIILPFSESNAKLLILVGDEASSSLQKPYDAWSPYGIYFEVLDNPDPNEPNDTTPTDIPLTASGQELVGQGTGVLATDDDVDKFSFTVPTGGRKILYLHLTAPKLTPPPPTRISYKLLNAGGTPIAEGVAPNEFIAVDLATARLLPGGTYTLQVEGYRVSNQTTPVAGDLRLTYTVDLRVMDDLDTNEGSDGNDVVTTAQPVNLSLGSGQTLVGRLAYVPDADWYRLDLPANANPTVLHARLRESTTGGRFPPVSSPRDRQLRVIKEVPAVPDISTAQLACKNDPVVCPKGFGANDPLFQLAVDAMCTQNNPPQCLMSERNEEIPFAQLKNFEANVLVPPHAGTVTYYVVVQDDGNNYADDLEYSLTLRWQGDADETARASLPGGVQATTIVEAASFPAPSTSGEVSGELTYGYGRLIDNDPLRGQGVRGNTDYDAYPTDVDLFQFDFPGLAGPPFDRTWALQWVIDHNDAGVLPADLSLEARFCDTTTLPDGGCGIARVLAYAGGRLQPWYSSNFTDRTVLWDKQVVGNTTVVTAQPAGCFCLEGRSVQAGRMFAGVGAADRQTWDPVRYRVRMSLTSYPQSYTGDGGASVACPSAGGADGGACGFTGTN